MPTTISIESATLAMPKGISLWEDAWLRLRKNKLAMFGLGFLVTVIVLCLLTPWIAPYGYEEQDLRLGAVSAGAGDGTVTFGLCRCGIC